MHKFCIILGRNCTDIKNRAAVVAKYRSSPLYTMSVVGADMINAEHFEVSEEYLKHYCDTEDLSAVKDLQIELDVEEQCIDSVGDYLPSLESLKLNGSAISCIRDLGTRFRNVKFLWLNRTGLKELDGLSSLPCLEELYISFNEVSELAPLQFHESLQILDLDANLIDDLTEIENLASCPELLELSVADNPVCKKEPNLLYKVKQCLPLVQVLDGQPVSTIVCNDDGSNVEGVATQAKSPLRIEKYADGTVALGSAEDDVLCDITDKYGNK